MGSDYPGREPGTAGANAGGAVVWRAPRPRRRVPLLGERVLSFRLIPTLRAIAGARLVVHGAFETRSSQASTTSDAWADLGLNPFNVARLAQDVG